MCSYSYTVMSLVWNTEDDGAEDVGSDRRRKNARESWSSSINNLAHFLRALTSYALTSSNIDRFSNLFHCLNREKFYNNTVTEDPCHTANVSLHYLVKCQCLKATIENKTSVTTHFKKLTTGKTCFLSHLLSEVTVTSCFFTASVQCVHLAVGRRTLKMCCCRTRLVFICCFEDSDISQGSVETHLRCGGIFSDSIITNVLLILTVK